MKRDKNPLNHLNMLLLQRKLHSLQHGGENLQQLGCPSQFSTFFVYLCICLYLFAFVCICLYFCIKQSITFMDHREEELRDSHSNDSPQ